MQSRRAGTARRAARAVVVPALCALALGLAPAGAVAQGAPTLFWKACKYGSFAESGLAGHCSIPRGIAAAPDPPGHLYVADQENKRVVELSAWGEFVKAWGWGVRDGAKELQTCGPDASPPSGCKTGLKGPGVGQFGYCCGTQGIATDSAGDVYVVDWGNHRVQKFSPEGEFLLMFGGGVNETSGGNVCPRPGFPTDVCKEEPASTGPGNGQFSASWAISSFIAVDRAGTETAADDVVYVGDEDRIQEFDVEGQYTGEVSFAEIHAKNAAFPEAGTVGALASDPASGDLYLSVSSHPDVYKIDSEAATQCTAEAEHPSAVAADAAGDLYVVETVGLTKVRALEFGAGCHEPPSIFGEEALSERSTGIATSRACFLAPGEHDVYATTFNSGGANSFVVAWGPPPDNPECPPPPAAPSIDDQWAVSVGAGEASVRAKINPHFWSGTVGETDYYVQYASAACIAAQGWGGACVQAHPAPSGAKLQAGVVNEDVTTAAVFLSGLVPGTAYRYRFVAEGSGAPGEPVAGVGGTPTEAGAEGSFTTFGLPEPPNADCPNQAFRTGPSAALPDCRAYEMVSPQDKDGGDAFAVGSTGFVQGAASGAKLTYTSYRAFGDVQSSPLGVQYLAARGGEGWSSESINPPREGASFAFVSGLGNLFAFFTPELSEAWLNTTTEPVLAAGGLAGFSNLYRRDNAGGGYEACTTAAPLTPPISELLVFAPAPLGASADGRRGFFKAFYPLAVAVGPEAAEPEKDQIYECSAVGGGTRELALVSVLPDGSASELANTLGTGHPNSSTIHNMASAEGSRAYWSATTGSEGIAQGPGALYLRLNPDRPESAAKDGEGNCLPEAGRACTLPVSAGEEAQYWGASPDGSAALFSEGEALYAFDAGKAIAGEEPRTPIAAGFEGLAGASEDLSRAYLVSTEDCSDEAPNERGEEAKAGEPNLYLYRPGESCSAGDLRFLARLAAADASTSSDFPSPVNPEPPNHTALAAPDGATLAFASKSADLAQAVAGYDSTDQATGEPDAELYRYQAATGKLTCLSCNPGGARPVGQEGAASRPPTWESSFYAPRALTDEGRRLFFESYEALVLADTNGAPDVYEWEAPGAGDCAGDKASFIAASGGCLRLISSGRSPGGAAFLDASASGEDVFFRTAASLVASDPGSYDIYDARVGGGFPEPEEASECEGQACQPSAAAPALPGLGSATHSGPGNLRHARNCAKQARASKRLRARSKRLRNHAKRARKAARAKAMRGKAKRLARRSRKLSGQAKRCRRSKRGQRR